MENKEHFGQLTDRMQAFRVEVLDERPYIDEERAMIVTKVYKENEDKGFPFLVKKVDNCKIFIMTWDDVFKNFEHKYRYLYEKLNFEKNEIEKELESDSQ